MHAVVAGTIVRVQPCLVQAEAGSPHVCSYLCVLMTMVVAGTIVRVQPCLVPAEAGSAHACIDLCVLMAMVVAGATVRVQPCCVLGLMTPLKHDYRECALEEVVVGRPPQDYVMAPAHCGPRAIADRRCCSDRMCCSILKIHVCHQSQVFHSLVSAYIRFDVRIKTDQSVNSSLPLIATVKVALL